MRTITISTDKEGCLRKKVQIQQEYINDPGIKMINHHRPEGFLPIQSHDGNTLVYMTEGYVELDTHLLRTVYNNSEIITLLKKMVGVLADTERYYLNESYIQLTSDCIYFEPLTSSIGLMYMPSKTNENTGGLLASNVSNDSNNSIELRLSNLIRELIYEKIRLVEPNSKFVSEVLKYLKEPGWHLKGLLYLIESHDFRSKNSGQKSNDEELAVSKEALSHLEHAHRTIRNESGNMIRSESKSQIESRTEKNKGKNVKGIKTEESNKYKMVLRIVLFILYAAAMIFVKTMTVDLTEKLGMILVISALLLLIYMKLVVLMGGVDLGKSKSSHVRSIFSEKKMNENQMNENQMNDQEENTELGQNSGPKGKSRFNPKTAINESNSEDKTMMIQSGLTGCSLIGSAGHKYPLNLERLIIGRQEGVADIRIEHNTSVGRQHAELIRIESGFAVKDMKSVNGTFVNDVRVEHGQAIALLNGDVLQVSDVRFTYSSIR